MRLVCPACGASASAEAWENDADCRMALRVVAELPEPVARRALGYLALFRPPSGRGLRWSAALRILSELALLVQAPTVRWERGPERANSAVAWGEAMERVCAAPPRRLPLKSHGYLRAVADELLQAEEARRERQAVEARRHYAPPPVVGEPVTLEYMRETRRKKGLLREGA